MFEAHGGRLSGTHAAVVRMADAMRRGALCSDRLPPTGGISPFQARSDR